MQKQVTYCDLCEAADVADGFPSLSFSGDRGQAVRAQISNRNLVDMCDACAESLVAWAKGRKEKPVAPVAEPSPVVHVDPAPLAAEPPHDESAHQG